MEAHTSAIWGRTCDDEVGKIHSFVCDGRPGGSEIPYSLEISSLSLIPFYAKFYLFFCLCFSWLFSHPTLRISDSILASTRLVDEGIRYSLSVYMIHWRGSSIEITLKKRTFQYLKSLNFTFWTSHWDFKPHVLNKGGLPVHDLRQFQW